ncbi:FAD-dependent oxidoreductase [Aeromicrobium sp. YIM 150415]|uniref:NAD(P)/FAD-dependent oxidoreductase n=1 Tax=Aeromicrobium sp. YIM 150415 TaxID=2803912 RepID=UPI001964F97E|nr:FAD-dependent oxidoreductase [Aeromicrobium sp. YIM 150415]MBM9465595.1 FAD-dependent oxidoreductase [Aeromicrobium sp. YIM 150415]
MSTQTVIVGGGVSSLRLAERLRRAGDEDPITIVSAEQAIAYDRPPLSKSVLLDESAPRPDLTSTEELEALGVRIVAGRRARRLDRPGRSIELETGEVVPYDDLVIATGSTPRRLPALDAVDPHYLRTWDDALALREAVHRCARVGVIGGGVLGLEIAATAQALSREVLVIDAAPHALARLGSHDLGRAVTDLHRGHGVHFRFDVTTESAVKHADGTITLNLSDGTEEIVDVLVVAIGAVPVTDWLDGSGLEGGDGVDTDASCRTIDERIHAIGDVARIEYVPGGHRRLEHWTNAGDTAAVAARGILARRRGETRPELTELPYVWSDQYDVKLQILGHIDAGSSLLSAVEDPETGRWLRLATRGHEVTGVVGWNMPAAVNRCRAALMAGISVDELLRSTPWERKARR